MKKRLLIIILIFALLFSAVVCFGAPRHTQKEGSDLSKKTSSSINDETKYTALNYGDVKAIWLSQFDMHQIYTEDGAQRLAEDYTARVKQVINNLKSLNCNTVFIQLRPNGDSIYPSELYPTSKYVSGRYGAEIEYDAFRIFLEHAHAAELSVHAWINPLRCMLAEELVAIPDSYAVKKWYDEGTHSRLVTVDGRCYLNPAYRETRALICAGIDEIMRNYEVDGIHIDDYFYPTTEDYFDAPAYSEYLQNGGILSLAEFRREQINTLMRDVYATVKRRNHTVLFGVSPGGNTDRNYNELYADVALWCVSDCYIDYLCPQIYFGFEHETHPFDEVSQEFSNIVSSHGVKLIIGMSLEKAYNGYNGVSDKWAGTGSDEWIASRDILKRSIEYTENIGNCGGVAFFSYRLFFDPESGEVISETRDEVEAFLTILA